MRTKQAHKIGSLSIAWMNIEIWYDPKLIDKKDAEGTWCPELRRITIGPQAVKGGEMDTVMHEAIHAIDALFNLNLNEAKTRVLASHIVQAWSTLKIKF